MQSTRDAYGSALVELGRTERNLVVLDADVSKATRTAQFAKEFPSRFINVGCAEANLIGTAAGLSLTGKIPVASTFAVFASCRSLDQIRNTVCYPSLNVKIVATHGGITVGADGASHQSIEDIAIMRSLPNMTVVVPCDSLETKKALREVVYHSGPVYVRLGRVPVSNVTTNDSRFNIGNGLVLQEGKDVAILACGTMVGITLQAAKYLAKRDISAKVINIHTIKPLDEQLVVQVAQETGAITTVEEHSVLGGLGGAVAEVISHAAPVPLERIGIEDRFAESGQPNELLEKYGLSVEHIASVVQQVVSKK